MPTYALPEAKDVKDILSMSVGRDVKIECTTFERSEDHFAAAFVDRDDNLVSVCECDARFVAGVGAALSMIPADVAQEMVSTGSFSDEIMENYFEVMNIISKLMITEQTPHLKLKETISPGQYNLAILENTDCEPRCFDIDVSDYGSSVLGFWIT